MKLLQCYLSLFVISASIVAQIRAHRISRTISGQVSSKDDGSKLDGVRVAVKGGKSISDSQGDGMFRIPVEDTDSVLVFYRDDCQPMEIRLAANNEYNVALRRK
jgi:hypothetical protein